ncbi:hypothetical protein PTKIN_Ptkin05aG0173000 [Pterospermum kingtungense]
MGLITVTPLTFSYILCLFGPSFSLVFFFALLRLSMIFLNLGFYPLGLIPFWFLIMGLFFLFSMH